VTVVSAEPLPQQARLGAGAAARIAGWLEAEGVTLLGDTAVEALAPKGDPADRPHRVHLAGRGALDADLVLVAGGIAPVSGLAAQAGADVEQDRVRVDEHLRSSVPGLLAAGDVACARNAAAGRHLAVEHWGEALAMGEVAGATAAGSARVWDSVPGFWTEIGDRLLQYAGWGDGYSDARLVDHGEGDFTVWYSDADGRTVGVAASGREQDYERGRALIASGDPVPDAG